MDQATNNEAMRIMQAALDSKLCPLKWDELVVDPKVQRALDNRRVEAMALSWNRNAAGTPTVSRRDDGRNVVLDGQHRRAAAVAIGSGQEDVQCNVFTGLTLEQEAELFALLNNTKHPTPLDLYKVAVVAGEPEAVAISALLRKVGLEAKTSGAHAFRSIVALRKLHGAAPVAAERTLLVLIAAFGAANDRGGDAMDSRLVSGVGKVLLAHGDEVDIKRLGDRLAKQAGGAPGMIGAARSLASIRRFSVHDAVADIAIELYNTNRRTNILSKLK